MVVQVLTFTVRPPILDSSRQPEQLFEVYSHLLAAVVISMFSEIANEHSTISLNYDNFDDFQSVLCMFVIPLPCTVGWSVGVKVLGKLSVPGRSTTLDYSRSLPNALAVGAGAGVVWIVFLSSIISFLVLPLSWGDGLYSLKYCLKGPFSPQQQTNKPCKTYMLTNSN